MKKNNKKGFTLAELLIVVAIIAVLVLIAIPVFTASLNKSKAAADEANARSLYAAMTAAYLSDSTTYAAPTAVTTAKSAVVTYEGNTYKFSDVCTVLTFDQPADGVPTVHLVTNGVPYDFPATT